MPATITAQARLKKTQGDRTPEAWLLESGGFPLDEEDFAWLQKCLEGLLGGARKAGAANLEVFLESNNRLPDDSFPQRLARHMPKWRPKTGLGIWPAREAPRLPTKADFEAITPGKQPAQFRYTVVRVTKERDARMEAFRVMGDLGNVLLVAGRAEPKEYFERTKAILTANISEQSFLGAGLYVPLLDWASVESAQPEQLEQWLAGASLYIRESLEDRGIVIVSTEPLSELFESFGFRREAGDEPSWTHRIEN